MEIEAKFRVPNREVHRDLLRLRSLAGYTIVRTGRVEVVDRYFDTADGRILAASYSCRLRTQGSQVIATLKGLDCGESAGRAESVGRAESAGGAADGLHRRDEREVTLLSLQLNPADWPESDARQLALDLTRGAPLQPLFDLNQSRAKADLMAGARMVGEWSLDEVRAVVGRRPAFYYELEIELCPDGRESDLERLARALKGELGLEPEPCSKFVRALEMLRTRGTAIEGGVSDEERAKLGAYAAGSDAELARRAGAVLGWANGLPTREIVARTRLSAGRVRFWLREFRAKRMGIFAPGAENEDGREGEEEAFAPASPTAQTSDEKPSQPRHRVRSVVPAESPALNQATGTSPANARPAEQPPRRPKALRNGEMPAEAAAARDAPVQTAETAQPPNAGASGYVPAQGKKGRGAAKEGLPTITDFAHVHGVRGPRARYVADNAGTLFDMLRKVHGLPRKRRKLLRSAALLAGVGASQQSEEPERAGRDLILAQPLHDVSTSDRLELACIVALQREKMKPGKEPALEALEPKQRKEAIALACLLQVASALTFDNGRSTRIATPECRGADECEITLEGPSAGADARRANSRARHWRENLKHDLSFVAAQPGVGETEAGPEPVAAPPPTEMAPEPAGAIPGLPPVVPDDPMAEAGRKVMFTHFMKMLANEEGTRKGEDIEFLHDMRVSTRRLRAAYRVFQPFYEKEAIARFNKELRRAGGTLGAVRDLDVLIEKAETYEASLSPEAGLSLAPLLGEWGAQREAARRELLAYLNSDGYQRFVESFRTFLLTPGMGAKAIPAGEPVAYQVRHIIPRLIMERYEQVRAYEAVLSTAPITTYHMLRIDCKRLRYALEFFAKLLGPGAGEVIKQVTAMQELLGAMQDAHVAEGLVVQFLSERRGRKKTEAMPGVEAYLLTQQQIQADLLNLFEAPWMALTGPDFRRSLGMALATP
jgi:CHAD domain-containing protein